MHRNKLSYCRICGYKPQIFPWGKDGLTPSFEICDCCGVEFGYEDTSIESIKKYRKNWLSGGAKWFDEELKPVNWNLEEQLRNIC